MKTRQHSIALIGFRATGKSLIGELLAKELGMEFVDMDERLMASLGQDINTWVANHGWESFREAESELLLSLARKKGLVLATGGGVILRPANRRALREHFLVVWLKASPDVIQARLAQDPKTSANRPPLTDLSLREEITGVLEERLPLYQETADMDLGTEGLSPSDVVVAIRAFRQREEGS